MAKQVQTHTAKGLPRLVPFSHCFALRFETGDQKVFLMNYQAKGGPWRSPQNSAHPQPGETHMSTTDKPKTPGWTPVSTDHSEPVLFDLPSGWGRVERGQVSQLGISPATKMLRTCQRATDGGGAILPRLNKYLRKGRELNEG